MSQHNTKDSVGEYEPGINGPVGKAGTRDADTTLGELLAALKEQGLDKTTDIFVTADHGFLTISHASATSPSARRTPNVPLTELASASWRWIWPARWHLRLFDPAEISPAWITAAAPSWPAARPLGRSAKSAGGGGAQWRRRPDLSAAARMRRSWPAISSISSPPRTMSAAIFVNDRLGKFPGALPMSDVEPDRQRHGRRSRPSMSASAASPANARTSCNAPWACTTPARRTGQGSHGSLSPRRDPQFHGGDRARLQNGLCRPAPISNADIAPTLAQIAGIDLPAKGKLRGRVITRGLAGRRRAKRRQTHHPVGAGGKWRAHHPELSSRWVTRAISMPRALPARRSG